MCDDTKPDCYRAREPIRDQYPGHVITLDQSEATKPDCYRARDPRPSCQNNAKGPGGTFCMKKETFWAEIPIDFTNIIYFVKVSDWIEMTIFWRVFFAQNNNFFWILRLTIHPWKEKKYLRKDLEDLEAFHKYKEAFDHFDWNKTKTIATSVSVMAENIWKLSIVKPKS